MYYPAVGGVQTVTENLVAMFRAAGVKSEVVSIWPGWRSAGLPVTTLFPNEHLHSQSVTGGRLTLRAVRRLPLLAYKRLQRWIALRRLRGLAGRGGRKTLVIATGEREGRLLLEAGVRATADGPVLIGQFHSSFESLEFGAPEVPRRLKETFEEFDCLVTLTQADSIAFSRLLELPCRAIPNPARSAVAERVAALDRGRSSSARVVALARYAPEKRLDRMIRWFAEATSESNLQAWRLELYGEGPERGALEAVIRSCDAEDRVALMGPTDDVAAVLATARLNLLTSQYEGFGMCMVEAAQAGVVSLAVACSPGFDEVAVGLRATLVDPDDEGAFTDALRELLRNPDELDRRGEEARAAVQIFAPDRIIDSWAALIDDIHRSRMRSGSRLTPPPDGLTAPSR